MRRAGSSFGGPCPFLVHMSANACLPLVILVISSRISTTDQDWTKRVFRVLVSGDEDMKKGEVHGKAHRFCALPDRRRHAGGRGLSAGGSNRGELLSEEEEGRGGAWKA